MRSELSKLPKDILIEIIEKGFDLSPLSLQQLRNKEKQVKDLIKNKLDSMLREMKDTKISEYTYVKKVSTERIYICKEEDGKSVIVYLDSGFFRLSVEVIKDNNRDFKEYYGYKETNLVNLLEKLEEHFYSYEMHNLRNSILAWMECIERTKENDRFF